MMEVLAGARDEAREDDLRRLLLRFDLLHFDATSDFDAAVGLYRRCRRAGTTPRGLIDCMIAAVAWRTGATPLSFDMDLDRLAKVVGVELDAASLRTSGGRAGETEARTRAERFAENDIMYIIGTWP